MPQAVQPMSAAITPDASASILGNPNTTPTSPTITVPDASARLRSDKRLIVIGAAKAQKAADYILNRMDCSV